MSSTHPVRDAIRRGVLCRHLRTKGMFVAGDEGPPPDLPHPTDTAAWWCNCSGWSMGPDLVPANRERCADPSRACFDPEVQG